VSRRSPRFPIPSGRVHPDHAALLRINGRITTTPEHRFYVAGRWVHAEELRLGDRLPRAAAADPGQAPSFEETVTQLELLRGGVTVYNLEVPGVHDYFADGVLVHNLKP
jgi:intein/homing endonuclease